MASNQLRFPRGKEAAALLAHSRGGMQEYQHERAVRIALTILKWQWLDDEFSGEARRALPVLLVTLYWAARRGDKSKLSKRQACELMGVDYARTGPRYMAQAQARDLIAVERSAVDKRKDVIRATPRLIEVMEREFNAIEAELARVDTERTTGRPPTPMRDEVGGGEGRRTTELLPRSFAIELDEAAPQPAWKLRQSSSELFEGAVEDIYYAEKALLKALPKLVKKATSKTVRAVLATHLRETEGQVARLNKVFKLLGKKAAVRKLTAFDVVLGEVGLQEAHDDTIRDTSMLAVAQSFEHYQISRYGTLLAWAEEMGRGDVGDLLAANLEEEKATELKLTALISEIDIEADENGDAEEAETSLARPRRGRKVQNRSP